MKCDMVWYRLRGTSGKDYEKDQAEIEYKKKAVNSYP
jgi:hypothetical protein